MQLYVLSFPDTLFLLTPLREGRRRTFECCCHVISISTHAPAGGATRFGVHAQNAGDDFYSRPCGRGDASRCIVIESIDKISTHAPAGGATRHEHKKRINIADFYSRPCGRGDVVDGQTLARVLFISTHAPAGGATRYGANSADSWFLFLLTPLREGRQYASNGKGNLGVFLLTPLREGRPKMAVTIADEEGFLLTPLREGRRSADQPWISHRSFLLTPLREGRPVKTVFIRVLVNFYSRPCGRGDHVVRNHADALCISTHAPAGGATQRRAACDSR